jgi:hypothetical protein
MGISQSLEVSAIESLTFPRISKLLAANEGRNAQQQDRKRKYAATKDSPDVRNTVGAIYAAMKRLGYEREARDKVLAEAGLAYPERTMRRYVERIEADAVPVPSPGTAGRKRVLTPEEEDFLWMGFGRK